MASPFIKLIKMIDTGEFSVLSTLSAHFCFFEASTGNRSPSLEGNLPSALPSLAFDWEQLNLFHCLLRPGCVALPAEISDSSSAPFYHLGQSQVGEFEEKRQFIALSL